MEVAALLPLFIIPAALHSLISQKKQEVMRNSTINETDNKFMFEIPFALQKREYMNIELPYLILMPLSLSPSLSLSY